MVVFSRNDVMKQKRNIKRFIIITLFLGLMVVLFFVCKKVRIINEAAFDGIIDLSETQLNYLQRGNPYSVYVKDNNLYFYSTEKECFGNALFQVEGHKAVKLLDFVHTSGNGSFYTETPRFFINNCLIYSVQSSNPTENAVVSFDIKTGLKQTISDNLSETELERVIDNLKRDKLVQSDTNGVARSVTFPVTGYDSNAGEYVRYGFCSVTENEIVIADNFDEISEIGRFSLGEYEYYVSDNWLIQVDNGGNEIKLSPLYSDALPIYVLDGKSVLLSQLGTTGVLKIDSDGSLTQLFPPHGGDLVYTAIQIHVTDLFISVRRYKHAELFNTSRFKKDEAEGLWRVNILTGEMEKLSGKMYEQLYIYDNSGIVACTFSKDIVKLDFDGRIIKYIVRGTVLDHLDEFWRNTFSKAE